MRPCQRIARSMQHPHPLANGLIDYATFIGSFATACGLRGRVHFVEWSGPNRRMDKSQGRVVLNSTLGIGSAPGQALVFHVGTAIYAMEGLAVNREEMSLDNPIPCHPRWPWRTLSACSKSIPMAEAISPPRRVSTRGLDRSFRRNEKDVE